MEIISNYPLKKHNTFGISAFAKEFVQVHTVQELAQVLQENQEKKLFLLGGGSNMLLTEDPKKAVLHINLKGKEILQENENEESSYHV